jgi:hypothetical protein
MTTMEGSIREQGSAESLLFRFMSEEDSIARECLERLLTEHAEPVIRRVVRKKGYTHEDEEDIRGHAVLQVIERLRDLRTSPAASPIEDFCSYVAVIASNACNRLLRMRYPVRWSLKNRVRYLLRHRPDFFLREDPQEGWVCGLTTWNENPSSRKPVLGPHHEAPDLDAFILAMGPKRSVRRMKPDEQVHALLQWWGRPLAMDDLLTLMAELWDMRDLQPAAAPLLNDEIKLCDLLPDLSTDVAAQTERKFFLGRLWREICELPLRQRTALLLNLRDGRESDALVLLVVTGVASARQIAMALDQTPEGFAELWKKLPLEDDSIAKLLGLSRQQVINLRKSARERLERRMAAFSNKVETR